jgi:hypothetical protein
MTTGHDLIVDPFVPMVEGGSRLTTWYAQGHSDGLGDRLLMFDNTSAPSWEILRFKPSLTGDPRFETALRHRVERLSDFHHPAFPMVRSIKELGHDSGLAVVSTYLSGVRLSDALRKPRSAEFALQLIRQLMPALNALHAHGPTIAHGALTPDRIVFTADGRLTIREHMVGSAIEGLDLSADELWSQFGIQVPPTGAPIPRLDEKSDVAQLALVALSLVAGRRIGPDEYPSAVPELLQRVVKLDRLREWLERALQLNDRSFKSAQEATDALAESPPQRDNTGFEASSRTAASRAPKPEDPQRHAQWPPVERQHPLAPTGIVPITPSWRSGSAIKWGAYAAGVIAFAEAVFIARMLLAPSPTETKAAAPGVIESLPPATAPVIDQPSVTPLSVRVQQEMPGIRIVPTVAAADVSPGVPGTRTEAHETSGSPLSAMAPRNGGLRISAPIELHVLDGERVLGSTQDGPIMTRAGTHELEFVNSVIGYRVRRAVDIKAGQITALSLAVPNGTLNVNAAPWASVWIDGTPYGETPLGNLSLVPGEHEIVFRHPQLGERREKVIVRPDSAARVAVSLQR